MIFTRHRTTEPWLTIIRGSLGLALFLVPLWYWTAFPEAWELPKALLFAAAVSVATVTWLIWSLRTGRFQASFGRFEFFLGCLVGAASLGTVFSVHPYSSLWGLTGLQSESFAIVIFLALFAFLLKQTTDAASVRWYLILFIASMTLTALGVLLTMGGLAVFPGRALGRSFLPTGTSPDILGLLLVIGWLTAWFLRQRTIERTFRRLLDVSLVLLLLVVALLDRSKPLSLLLVGLAVFFVLSWSKRFDWRTKAWPIAAGLVAVVGLAVRIEAVAPLPVNTEVSLPGSTSFAVTRETLERLPVLGSGPGTFYYDFVRYRPASFESLSIGRLRFVRPDAAWWQYLATYGLAGTALLVSLFIFVVRQTLTVRPRGLWHRRPDELGQVAPWLFFWSILGFFLTAGSMAYAVVVWAGLGLAVAGGSGPESARRESKGPARWRLIAGGALVGLVISWYFLGRIWLAPLEIASANRALAATAPLPKVAERLDAAIRLDPWNAGYRLKRAEHRLAELQLQTASAAGPLLETIVERVKAAEARDPNNPALRERSIRIFVELAAVKREFRSDLFERYKRLVAIEPSSAANLIEWGKAELVAAQNEGGDSAVTVDQPLAQSALAHFGQALALKPGDLDGRYHQALAHELLGNRAVAKGIMRELAVQYPNEADLLYELARQERLDGNADEALRLLNQAVEIVPQSIAVRLELARVYEAKGEFAKAIEILKVIDRVRPNTPAIADWIKRLEAAEATPSE